MRFQAVDQALMQRSQKLGVETSFLDVNGVEQHADERAIRFLVDLLSLQGSGDSPLIAAAGSALPPIEGGTGTAHWTLLHKGIVRQSGSTMPIELEPNLEPGHYLLELTLPSGARRSRRIIVTPPRAFQPRFAEQGEKTWVLSVQLYSLHTADNWGHGDFGDVMRLLQLVDDAGGGGIGLNPLHALDDTDPNEASPYAPSSRLFINPLYIDIASVPGVSERDIAALRPAPTQDKLIDYAEVAKTKTRALRLAYAQLVAGTQQDLWQNFLDFRQRTPDLRRYAAFCVLRQIFGRKWREWPAQWREPDDVAITSLDRDHSSELGFHEFLQFLAEGQLSRCREYAKQQKMAVGLYLDLAVGVHPDGFDAWNDQAAYLQGASIGAPPDPLNRAGQNWGLTAFNPAKLAEQAYLPFRHMLASVMQHAGAIRIDHVLGLNRLYVVPPGCDAAHGAYIRMPLKDLLSIAAMESQRHRCLIIGEDLGTVPDGLRATLRDFGIWTYRVVMFEQDDKGGFLTPLDYPADALVTFSTHDLPTFAGWTAGADIELAKNLGLAAGDTQEERRRKVQALQHTIAELTSSSNAGLKEDLDFASIVRFLAHTPCHIAAVALDDILQSSRQINVPGTYKEYPNWRQRLQLHETELRDGLATISRIFRQSAFAA
jgi:4-alpha-glucanotransferase